MGTGWTPVGFSCLNRVLFPIYFVIPNRSRNSFDERRNLLALGCKWRAQTATATVTEEGRQRTHVVRKISLKCNMYCSSSVFLCIETAVRISVPPPLLLLLQWVFISQHAECECKTLRLGRTLKLFDFEEAATETPKRHSQFLFDTSARPHSANTRADVDICAVIYRWNSTF